MGWGGHFRGPKIKSPGNVIKLPRKSKKNSKPGGGGGWGGSFRGSKNQKSWKCHELPRKSKKKMLNPGGRWGGVDVLGVNIL